MDERPSLRSRLRDPWTVAGFLIALIGILALSFPKPERAPEADAERVRAPPPGWSLALLSEARSVSCWREGQEAQARACALLGVEEGMVYHLRASWSVDEVRQGKAGRTFQVQGARVDLLENHQEQYAGPIRISLGEGGEEVLAEGGRVDNRTLRAPLGEESTALDAAVAEALRGGSGDVVVEVRADPQAESSVDEFVPQLSFFYRAE